MTEAEKKKIKRAIRLLCADDRFEEAINILHRLAFDGEDSKIWKVLKNAKSVSIEEVFRDVHKKEN